MGRRPAVDRREVERIAGLAHLTVDHEDTQALARELTAVVDHFRTIERLDVSDVEPTRHPVEFSARWRQDDAGASLPVERALAGAPERVGDRFAVPLVIEE